MSDASNDGIAVQDSVPAGREEAGRLGEGDGGGRGAPRGTATQATEPLDPRVVALWRVQNMIVAAVLALGSVVALGVAFLAGWVGTRLGVPLAVGVASVVCAVTVCLHRWPETEYRHAGYRLDHDVVEIRRGVVWRHVQHVPRSRVQHTDVTQGPLERSFGLATVVIHTAGTQYARVSIEGLDHDRAVHVRDRLLPRQVPDGV